MYRREGPSCLGQLMLLIIGAAGVLLILWATGIVNPLDALWGNPAATINAPGPAIIQQLRARNEWITYSYQADQMIEASKDGNALQNLLFGDRLLLQARGEVAAGVDMSELDDSMILSSGTTITVTLPATRIIYSRLDNENTRVYDRQRGWLSKGDVNIESNARTYAEQSILQSACDGGVLDKAALQAQQNVADLLKASGYTVVTVNVSKVGDCVKSANSGSAATPPPVTPAPTSNASVPIATPPGGILPSPSPDSNSLTGTAVPLPTP